MIDEPAPEHSTDNGEQRAGANRAESRAPHPLDDDHDVIVAASQAADPHRRTRLIVTAVGSALTGIVIGAIAWLTNTIGAGLLVTFFSTIMFAPLWYALCHQNYAERYGWMRRGLDLASGVSAADSNAPAGTSEKQETADAVGDRPIQDSTIDTPKSYYRSDNRPSNVSLRSFAIVSMFALLMTATLMGAPFLAALFVSLWG